MDVTAEIKSEVNYIPPSVEEIVGYASEIEEEGKNINFKWADEEIKNHLLSYVRVGVLAQKIRLYRLWKHAEENYKSFKEYCEKGLGKSYWAIKKIIEAARVTLELAQAGFNQLPQYEAQARPLTKFSGENLIEKWNEVIKAAPAHRITASLINEIVDGEQNNPKKRISLPKNTYQELIEKARAAGKKPEELLKELLENYDPLDEEYTESVQEYTEIEEEIEEKVILTEKQLENWLLDMKQLLAEKYRGLNLFASLAENSS